MFWTWDDASWKCIPFNCLLLSKTTIFLSTYKHITERKPSQPHKQTKQHIWSLPFKEPQDTSERRQTHTEALHTVPNSNLSAKWAQTPTHSFMHKSRCKHIRGATSYSRSLAQRCAGCRSSRSSGQSKFNFILCELQMQFLLLHPGKSTAAILSSHGGFTKVIFQKWMERGKKKSYAE